MSCWLPMQHICVIKRNESQRDPETGKWFSTCWVETSIACNICDESFEKTINEAWLNQREGFATVLFEDTADILECDCIRLQKWEKDLWWFEVLSVICHEDDCYSSMNHIEIKAKKVKNDKL